MGSLALASALAVVVVLAGCGGSSHPTGATTRPSLSASASSSAAKLPGFLSIAPNGAIFLQWQRQGNAVTGKLSESYYDPSDPTQLVPEAESFTGTITGSQISITINSDTTWSGTISGSSMTLSYTDPSDGSLKTLDFHPANAAQYNAAVAETKARVAGATSRQQRAQAVSNAQQQVDSDASALSAAVQSMQEDTSSLNQDSFASDLSSIHQDVQTVQGDLKTVQSDSSDVSCDDAGVASDDAGVAADDEGVLNDDAQVYTHDVQTVLGDTAAIHASEQQLATDNAAVPNYTSPNEPTETDIAAALRVGQSAVAAERQRVKVADAQATQLVAQARSIAAQAHAAGCH